MNKKLFTFLSFTWGLPLTLVGAGVALVLTTLGYKAERHRYCVCFKFGENWGGLNLGYFIFTCTNAAERTPNHEFGHALQNCVYGVFTPFIVTIPSAIRYWSRVYKMYKGLPIETPYDAIWFERQATEWGNRTLVH